MLNADINLTGKFWKKFPWKFRNRRGYY